MKRVEQGSVGNFLKCWKVKMGIQKQLLRVHGMVYVVHASLSSFFRKSSATKGRFTL